MRDAFSELGHWAVSCDLLPTESPGHHLVGDVLKILDAGWDLMVAHPPCTYLAVSGARWFRERRIEQERALSFVQMLMDAPIPRIAIENPVSVISSRIRKPDQIIQPYEFGHDASKKTCLWLKGLPKLSGTERVPGRIVGGRERWGNQCDSGQNKLGPGSSRGKVRAKTYFGIARAMAEQWGGRVEVSACSLCGKPLNPPMVAHEFLEGPAHKTCWEMAAKGLRLCPSGCYKPIMWFEKRGRLLRCNQCGTEVLAQPHFQKTLQCLRGDYD